MMENLMILSLWPPLGVLISVIVSIFISRSQNNTEKIKIYGEFVGKLYSKRLEAYLEIFELISDYVKIIKRKGLLYEELLDFYEKYSKLDSKSGLLFSYTAFHSDKLMIEIREILSCKKCEKPCIFSENQKTDLINKLGYVETTMKLELGVYAYRDPTTIIEKINIPERKKEIVNDIMHNYLKGNYNNKNKLLKE